MRKSPPEKSNPERCEQHDVSRTADTIQRRRRRLHTILNCTHKPPGFFQSWKSILTWLEEIQAPRNAKLGTIFDILKTTPSQPHELPPHIPDIQVNRLRKLQRILVKHKIDIDHLHPCIFRFLHLADTKMAVILQGLSLVGRMPKDITPDEKKLFLICIFARIGKIPDDYLKYTTPDELITAVLGEEIQDAFIEKHSRYTGPSTAYSWMGQNTSDAQHQKHDTIVSHDSWMEQGTSAHTLRDYIDLTLWEEPEFQGIFMVEEMNKLFGAFALRMILQGKRKESEKLEEIQKGITGLGITREQALANWILFLKSDFTSDMTVAQFIAQELDTM